MNFRSVKKIGYVSRVITRRRYYYLLFRSSFGYFLDGLTYTVKGFLQTLGNNNVLSFGRANVGLF